MTRPGRYDIAFKLGDRLFRSFTFDDGAAPPAPLNLTGYTPRLQVRAGGSETDPLVADLTSSLTVTGASGLVTLEVSGAVTATYPAGRYRWALVLVDGSGRPRTWVEGDFEVLARVTKQTA
jgi:hypothetical protein